jgi:hypothetical protein
VEERAIMNNEIGKRLLPFILLLALATALVLPVLAQTGGGYDLTWSTVDGGGATFSEGGGYKLGGTIGQPDAGAMADGDYALSGGFWGGIVSVVEYYYHLYLPLILKNYGP